MSRKERNRLTIMTRVKQRVMTLVVAAGLMGLGYRQAKRVWRRYQAQGDAGLGAAARLAAQPGCGSGQHLPVRRVGQRGRATGGQSAANPVWPGDGEPGRGTDLGQQPASQRAGGTDERRAPGPAGQGATPGREQRSGKREPVFSGAVFAGVQPAVQRGGGQSRGRASGRAPGLGRRVALGSGACGATGLDGGQRRALVSTGPAARGVEPGGQESDCADVARRPRATDPSWEETEVAATAGPPGTGRVGARAREAGAPHAGAESSVAALGGSGGAGMLAGPPAAAKRGPGRAYSCRRGRVRYAVATGDDASWNSKARHRRSPRRHE